jgi:hypothetical protein
MKYEVVYICLGLEIVPSYLRNVLLVELSHYLATNQGTITRCVSIDRYVGL